MASASSDPLRRLFINSLEPSIIENSAPLRIRRSSTSAPGTRCRIDLLPWNHATLLRCFRLGYPSIWVSPQTQFSSSRAATSWRCDDLSQACAHRSHRSAIVRIANTDSGRAGCADAPPCYRSTKSARYEAEMSREGISCGACRRWPPRCCRCWRSPVSRMRPSRSRAASCGCIIATVRPTPRSMKPRPTRSTCPSCRCSTTSSSTSRTWRRTAWIRSSRIWRRAGPGAATRKR